MPRSTVATNGPIHSQIYRALRGGELCLDFINTVDRHAPEIVPSYDYLAPGYANVLAWSEYVGIVDGQTAEKLRKIARKDGRQPAIIRRRAVSLRDVLFTMVHALHAKTEIPATTLDLFSRELAIARAAQRLVQADGQLSWQFPNRSELDAVLWPVVLSAINLFESPRIDRIGECEGEECEWLFIDTSKNHSRRFCSSTECGNRTRIRRFRERQTSIA